MTVLRNVSVEGDLWAEERLDQLMDALNTGKEKRSEEKVTVQGVDEETDTVHSKRTEEHDIKKTESEKQTRGHTESDVIKKEVKEKEDQQGQNLSDAFSTRPVLTAWNTTYLQEVEGEEHLPPTVNQYTTPPAMATAFQPVLHLLKESVTQLPSSPSTSQRQATAETLAIITNNALSFKTTVETTILHIVNSTAEAMGTTLLVNESSTIDDLRVKLHVTNASKLHPLEEVSVDVTAMAARAGPTAKTPPSTFMAKLPKKAAGAKLKDNTTLKVKKKKVIKGKVKKTTKVLKKAKKVKKFKRERKLKPTTPSYFPYFEDHYCPSECSCYGRYVSARS